MSQTKITEVNLELSEDEVDSGGGGRIPVKKPRSNCYEHFSWDERTSRYFCKYCSANYTKDKTGGTGGLLRHLRVKHPNYSESSESSAMKKYLQTGNCKSTEKFSEDGLYKRLIKFIVAEDQPFTIVESEFFRDLLTFCNPNVKLPSADTIRNRIHKEYEDKRQGIAEELNTHEGKISFAVDCWTSSNQIPFQRVIGQWITSDLNMREMLLNLSMLDSSHSGANLSESFIKVLNDFKIFPKTLAIACDNARNMDTFCAEFSKECKVANISWTEGDQRVRCLAHILNLTCKAAIEQLLTIKLSTPEDAVSGQCDLDLIDLEDEDIVECQYGKTTDIVERLKSEGQTIIGKLRRGIIKIRSSPQRRESFRQCGAAQCKPKMVRRDDETRWNSTYKMMQRARKVKEPPTCTLLADKQLAKYVLTEEEWNKIDYIIDLLYPFQEMTFLLEEAEFPSISSTSLVYTHLYRHLEKYLIDEKRKLKAIDPKTKRPYPEWIRTAAAKTFEKLDKYYPTSDGLVYIVSTILDPRCKLQWFKSVDFPPDMIASYRKDITACWEINYKNKTVDKNSPGTSSAKVGEKLNLFSLQMKKSLVDKSDELQIYLSEKPVDADNLKGSPLPWWQRHEDEFPNLSKMARDYLAVPGTSVSMKRASSAGPDLLSSRRQSLTGKTISECLCLKAWYKSEQKADYQRSLRLATTAKIFPCHKN